MRFISTLCAVTLMAPVIGISQTVPPREVDAGSRVRIAAPVFGTEKQVGTVVSVTRDTLVLRRGANLTTQSVATSDITALEVSKGSQLLLAHHRSSELTLTPVAITLLATSQQAGIMR